MGVSGQPVKERVAQVCKIEVWSVQVEMMRCVQQLSESLHGSGNASIVAHVQTRNCATLDAVHNGGLLSLERFLFACVCVFVFAGVRSGGHGAKKKPTRTLLREILSRMSMDSMLKMLFPKMQPYMMRAWKQRRRRQLYSKVAHKNKCK